MDTYIQEFIFGKRIALVGASRSNDKFKFGNMDATELKQRGCEIYLVNPRVERFHGEVTYPNLSMLKERVDGVFVILPATKSADDHGMAYPCR